MPYGVKMRQKSIEKLKLASKTIGFALLSSIGISSTWIMTFIKAWPFSVLIIVTVFLNIITGLTLANIKASFVHAILTAVFSMTIVTYYLSYPAFIFLKYELLKNLFVEAIINRNMVYFLIVILTGFPPAIIGGLLGRR